jgi:carbonic anhydrase
MNILTLLTGIAILSFSFTLHANSSQDPSSSKIERETESVLQDIIKDNEKFAKTTPEQEFKVYKNTQKPRATMILCSDSRVQVESFDVKPENNVFVVRNIGNQLATALGSVEYGIEHLHTPVLFIVGHSGCGAIQAAYGDYSKESAAIQKELNTLDIKSAPDLKQAVLLNVNQQVEAALQRFASNIKTKELIIVGGVYDFRDDYHRGEGRFIITNLNGETDPQKIKNSPYFEKIKGGEFGVPKP